MKQKLAKKLWLGGALSGAATGASAGSVFGGIGAPVGAVVGFAGGLISHNKRKREEREREQANIRSTDMYLQNLDFVKNQRQDKLNQFKADQEYKSNRYQLAANESVLRHQGEIDSMADESYFRDYAGGQGAGFGTNTFYKMGGNMKLAKPDVLGVRQDPTKGGYIDNSASNAGVVRGRSHEKGGVKLPGAEVEGNESIVQSPFTGETQVHSDEMGASDITNKLAERKGEIEDKLSRLSDEIQVIEFNLNSETTSIRRNSYQRQYDSINANIENLQQEIAEIDAQIEQVYQAQEGAKAEAGIPTAQPNQPMQEQVMNWGGPLGTGKSMKASNTMYDSKLDLNFDIFNNPAKFDDSGFAVTGNNNTLASGFNWGKAAGQVGKFAEFATPFIDNIFNMNQARRLRNMDIPAPPNIEPELYGDPVLNSDPTILKPVLDKPTYLDPTYDVSDKMSQVERNTAGTTNRVMSNVSDSRIGRALSTNIGVQGTQMKGSITTEKLNQERVGRNANRQIAQEVGMRNTEKINRYNAINADRRERVQMANVDLTNAYARGDTDMINQYNMMNQESQYKHALAKFDKAITSDITMPSQNVAQIRDEIIGILDRRDMRSYQDKQIALQALLGKGTGVAKRNWADILGKGVWERLQKEFNINT